MLLTPYDIALYVLQNKDVSLKVLKRAYEKLEPPFSVPELPITNNPNENVFALVSRARGWELIITDENMNISMNNRVYTANHVLLKRHIITIPLGRKVETVLIKSGYDVIKRKVHSSGSIYYTILDKKKDEYVIRVSDHKQKCKKGLTDIYRNPDVHIILSVKDSKIFGLHRLVDPFLINQQFIDEINETGTSLLKANVEDNQPTWFDTII